MTISWPTLVDVAFMVGFAIVYGWLTIRYIRMRDKATEDARVHAAEILAEIDAVLQEARRHKDEMRRPK
jgi:hypothetical protein